MRSNVTQADNAKRQPGVRLGVWVAVLTFIVLVLGVLICLAPRSNTDNLPAVTASDTKMTTEVAGHGVALADRLRILRQQQSPSPPEYVYQGRQLSEWVGDLYSTDQEVCKAARAAFRVMGADATPAIPSIAALLHSCPLPNQAAMALVDIGTNSLPTLIDALTNGTRIVRMEVAGAIRGMRDGAESAVPALVECLRHEDAFVRANAIGALQGISKNPDMAVPALTVCLTDTDALVRYAAATTISNYGRAAESAIPVLARVAKEDADPNVRTRAAEAVREISPERANAERL